MEMQAQGWRRTRREAPDALRAMGRIACAILPLVLAACANIPAATDHVQFEPAVAEGRRIVIRACAGCHSTSLDTPSAYRAAPPFWSLALEQTPESLQRAAAETSAHRFAMPSIVLTLHEAQDVVAYMRAVAKADPKTRRALGAPPCIATAQC